MKPLFNLPLVQSSILGVFACLMLSACATPRIAIEPNFALKDKDEMELVEDEVTEPKRGYHSSSIVKSKNRTYASVKLYFSEDSDEKPLVIDLKRHDRAYLAETTLYQQDKMATYFSVGLDRDSRFVAGIRMRWNF